MRRQCTRKWTFSSYVIVLLAVLLSLRAYGDPIVIRYPSVTGDDAYINHTNHTIAVLRLILDKSGVNYQLQPVPVSTIPESRVSIELQNGRYDVCWLHTNTHREKLMRPIRIPISRGLLGWRVAFISPERQTVFSKIKSLSDLRAFSAGQGHDWPDTRILRANNLPVTTSVNRDSLLAMLVRDRIDYFPRSIAEIWDELDMHKKTGVMVEPNFAFWYPTAEYFFVRQSDERLANLIGAGFESAINDGTFQALFDQHYADVIRKAKLERRTILHLKNPYIPSETPLSRLSLWYMPPGVDLLTAIAAN